jgi:hypothetical protein
MLPRIPPFIKKDNKTFNIVSIVKNIVCVDTNDTVLVACLVELTSIDSNGIQENPTVAGQPSQIAFSVRD